MCYRIENYIMAAVLKPIRTSDAILLKDILVARFAVSVDGQSHVFSSFPVDLFVDSVEELNLPVKRDIIVGAALVVLPNLNNGEGPEYKRVIHESLAHLPARPCGG